jgi:hypothetical protein
MRRLLAIMAMVLAGCCGFALDAAAQAVNAVPDSGTADAGIGSRPIANVVANDTVNGAQAVLGASGNATIAKVGSWPSGITLNTTTGAVTTSASLAVGIYSVQYQLCDTNTPPDCATATDTINVIASSIVANPDSGTADAGIGSQPIANVTANDSVNGATPVLGSAGNATISRSGTWPTGIALNTTTGAVTTSASLAAGPYSVAYQLCDRNAPANCATTSASVNVIIASIVANPDSGTADAGIGSQPIANVTANDSVNGATPVLGPSGTATISRSGTWPTGIALNTTTGAVTTSASLAAGPYSVAYQLCDRNVPANCVTTTDTVNVINSSIVANPDSGTAAAGTASRPIQNVAANDTVNGSPATLGGSGNATVQQSGSWPSGFAFNSATGAVTVTAMTAPNTYNFQYQLCDRNVPANCVGGNISVLVAASIVANPVSGFTTVGTAERVIANVVASDTVNGAPAVLGPGGNSTLTPSGTWPAGLGLSTTTGAITSSTTLALGTYPVQFQLCDLFAPPDCQTGTATVTVQQQASEVQATATAMGDIEFDWGRDGVTCLTCNFGNGNARANWTDRNNNLWIAHLDPTTGLFVSAGANDELADTNAAFWNTYGNGPEWAFSTQNGQVNSQLVYSRYVPNKPQTPAYTGAAFATQTGTGIWAPAFFPGAIGTGNSSNLPEGSQCNSDPVALAMYKNFATPFQMFTEPVTTAAGTQPTLAPIQSNGIGERFIPCTHQLTFQADAPSGNFTFQQVFWYDIDSQVVEQLTTDQTTKYSGFMFRAPDFGDNFIMIALANHSTMQVYEQTGTNPDGSPIMSLVNSIVSPDSNELFMNSSEPFIHCNPTCRTYAFVTLCEDSTCQNGITHPNGLGVMALDPNNPMFTVLVTQNSTPLRQRLDPEYYITPNGPYLYYNRIVPLGTGTQYHNEGEFFIDMGLGPPSGPCVGSSAEGGLLPGC